MRNIGKVTVNLEELDGLFLASIGLPNEVADELNNKENYIIGFDGKTLSATTESKDESIKSVLTRLQEHGYTGVAKLNRVPKKILYEIKVKNWMTKPATEEFDFHTKWNNDNPMPMAIMEGYILQETKGMYRMRLTGSAEPSTYCRVCGAKLTNKVSLLYGIGPECSSKIGIPRIASEEELQENYEEMKKIAQEVVWEGWVIKKGIKEMNEVL